MTGSMVRILPTLGDTFPGFIWVMFIVVISFIAFVVVGSLYHWIHEWQRLPHLKIQERRFKLIYLWLSGLSVVSLLLFTSYFTWQIVPF